MAKVALVTVLFNSESVLEGFFASISAQTFKDYHLYLIDNQNSTAVEQLVGRLAAQYPISQYIYIKNETNVGVAAANNQGIKLSIEGGSAYTVLLNNDIEFEQNDLFERIYKTAVERNESLVIPKILYYDTRKMWMAGGDFLEYKGITMHVGQDDDDGPKYSKGAYFNYAPTCFMMIDNNVFAKIGIMNEAYFVYYDDTDFLYRAKNTGYKIWYMPEITILHKVSTSTGGGESAFSIFYNHRNRIYFILSYKSFVKKIVALGYTFFSRILRYIKYDSAQKKALWGGVKAGISLSKAR